jgi:ribosome-binding protein aMBF1 (putative translation factor)
MMQNWNKLKNKLLKDKEVKQVYEDLDLEYKFIESLIDMRLAKKITQKELSHRIGTTQSALARFESGKVNPSLNFLKRLATGIGAKLEIKLISN